MSRSEPFFICPLVHGVGTLEDRPPGFAGDLRKLLDELEPGGPAGGVRVGFTAPLSILTLLRSGEEGWRYDPERLDALLELVRGVGRPVVFQLTANHFSEPCELTRSLAADPVNTMSFADGVVPHDRYFGSTIHPFTLSADPEVPVNRYRFLALRETVAALRRFDQEHPGLVVGLTLNGETHHLYDDFYGGGSSVENIRVTDYSDLAQREFRSWLRRRWPSLGWLNRAAGTCFDAWDEVTPPASPRRAEEGVPLWNHLDPHAHGLHTVEGWLHSEEPIACIRVLVDGIERGRAQHGVSRPDIPIHVPETEDPNTGFRCQLDYRALEQGEHCLEAVLETTGARRGSLGARTFRVVASRPELAWLGRWRRRRSDVGPFDLPPESFRCWLDLPQEGTELHFNPYARLWHRFRESQAEGLLDRLWAIAVSTGFDRRRLFSHQIVIEQFGLRNEFLYATGGALQPGSRYQPGVTLYGGLAVNRNVLDAVRGRRYAVTELHPMSTRTPALHERALRLHRERGAAFVAPFYVSSIPISDPEYRRFWIDPSNEEYGSKHLYEAIRELARD